MINDTLIKKLGKAERQWRDCYPGLQEIGCVEDIIIIAKEAVARCSNDISVSEENRILREAIYPHESTKGTSPLILYFTDENERKEFIELYKQVRPNARSYNV